jgi:hypothetical protein
MVIHAIEPRLHRGIHILLRLRQRRTVELIITSDMSVTKILFISRPP